MNAGSTRAFKAWSKRGRKHAMRGKETGVEEAAAGGR